MSRNVHPNPAAGGKRGKSLVFPSKEGSGRKTLLPSWNFVLIRARPRAFHSTFHFAAEGAEPGAGSWRNTQSLSPPINNRFGKSTLHYFQQLPPLALMLLPAFSAHGKEQNDSSGWLFPPLCQILAPEQQDVAIQAGIDGMQQHFLNEMEISQPRRVPRPSRVWLSPKGPGSAALVSVGM